MYYHNHANGHELLGHPPQQQQQGFPSNSQDSQEAGNLQAIIDTLRSEVEISELVMALVILRENILAHQQQQ